MAAMWWTAKGGTRDVTRPTACFDGSITIGHIDVFEIGTKFEYSRKRVLQCRSDVKFYTKSVDPLRCH